MAAALRHDALVYSSGDEFVNRSLEFLQEGLEAGEGGIVAHNRVGLATMREALGDDADRVTFLDVSRTYTRPARALAAYCGCFLEQLRHAPSVRAVADMPHGPASDDWNMWVGYEALTNVAYAHLPVWVLCAYNARTFPDRVLDNVRRTHSEVLHGDDHLDGHLEDPAALLRALTPVPEPLPGLRSLSPGNDVERFREQLAGALVTEHVPEAKALDMLVAGTEVAANAVHHGGGIEAVRVGRAYGRFVCEVIDRGGGFNDPTLGFVAPRPGTPSGLWVARQLTWSIETFRSPRGFTVRMWL
jgi:anti-sigma regulatory factor (Ser/Thr protein kinase)